MIPISYNVRSLAVRKATTVATALGIGLVVFVLASALMLAHGVQKTMGKSGQPENAIVMRKGSDSEMQSTIEDPLVGIILSASGVAQDASGKPVGTAEVVSVATMDKFGTDGVSNVQFRGVRDDVMSFRPEVSIIEGRMLSPGTDEVIVGKQVRGRFRGLDIGQSVDLRKNRPVRVVGVFAANGSSFESEVWGDLDTIRAGFGRMGNVSSVRVRLESPSKLDGFEAAVEQDKQLGLEVLREDVYYEKQSEGTSVFITAMGMVIAVFFSIGAMIGAMITMYAAVAGRTREIGTLRALGFSRFAILASFLLEASLLAVVGGVVGSLAALAMGAVKFSMMNFTSFSEITFSFTPTPEIVIGSVVFAILMGLLGGLFPAVRAARVSPVQAMRAG